MNDSPSVVDILTDNLLVFFAMAIVISLSGVMTPGPVFAAAVAKGLNDRKAGIKIALGHGIVEFPLMALIFLSLGYVFENETVKVGIGLVGGALLLYLGFSMIRSRREIAEGKAEYIPYDAITAGALTTSVNPYFFLWWASVGAVLIFNAEHFGAIVIPVFAVVHWSCDLAWYSFTSFAVFRTKHLWTPFVHQVVFVSCGALMLFFGAFFIIKPLIEM